MENDKIGIALAGGGMQGFSHIGALEALEELGIKAKYISGTSSGSVMASLYAMGYSIDEMKEMGYTFYKKIAKVKKGTLMRTGINYLIHKESRTEGLIDGKVVADYINEVAEKKEIHSIQDINLKDLAIETVDTKTMKECIFCSKKIEENEENINYIYDIDIGKCAQSSMAFPGIFKPSSYKDYSFIDGGTVNNLPVRILKKMGAEKVISVSFDLNKYNPSKNLEDVVVRALDIFSLNSVLAGRKEASVNIEIYNPDTGLVNIKDLKDTMQNGYKAVMEKKEEIIKSLS